MNAPRTDVTSIPTNSPLEHEEHTEDEQNRETVTKKRPSSADDNDAPTEKRPHFEPLTNLWKYTHWIALDLVTAGRQGPDLGRDQSPIVQISLVLGSFSENRIIDRFRVNLRPECFTQQAPPVVDQLKDWLDHSQATESRTRSIVPISLDAMKAACWHEASQLPGSDTGNLSQAIASISEWLTHHDVPIGQDIDEASVLLLTDGHLPVRSVLHAQAAYTNICAERMQKSPWSLYVNVLDWFNSGPCGNGKTDLDEAISVLNPTESTPSEEAGPLRAEKIAELATLLIKTNIPLCGIQVVKSVYEHRTLWKEIELQDSCVVEVRQVPWGATPANIARFFSGLNVIPGGVAIRLTEGRRSNTAIVAFDCALCAQLALNRHQHYFCGPLFPESMAETSEKQVKDNQSAGKSVLLQVYTSSARDFVQCAASDQSAVIQFLDQLTNGNQVVVRMRGLPYTATKQQILNFFAHADAPVLLDSNGIYLVTNPDGRPTGDAFVLFNDDKVASKALTRHKEYLGDRYVELFKASPSEMVQVCSNVSQQQQQQNTSLTTTKLSKSELQSRMSHMLQVNTPTLTGLNTNPYLIPTPTALSTLTQIKTPSILNVATSSLPATIVPQTMLPFGLPSSRLLATNTSTLDTVIGLPVTMTANQQYGKSIHDLTVDMSRDLKDPTDPDCPYARPLPPGGVSAMIQLSGLPLDTPRHDIRLYLGPVNMAKVYRMRRMDPKPNQTTSNWLISISNPTEAIQLIRDLVNRTFNLSNVYGTTLNQALPNLPLFALYQVGPDKSPVPISLSDPSMGIPPNRIYGQVSMVDKRTEQVTALTASSSGDSKVINLAMMNAELMQNQSLQNILMQNQIQTANQMSKNLMPFSTGSGGPVLSLLQGIPQIGIPLTPTMQTQELQTMTANPSQAVSTLGQTSCMVVLTGAPVDVTNEEVLGFFQPISHLLSVHPQFTILQANSNGTVNLLVTFATQLEAQAASICCPSGTMRNRQYVIGVASLLPPGQNAQPGLMMDLPQGIDPLTSLMLLQPPISNPGLLQ